jgi:hypothetical protein
MEKLFTQVFEILSDSLLWLYNTYPQAVSLGSILNCCDSVLCHTLELLHVEIFFPVLHMFPKYLDFRRSVSRLSLYSSDILTLRFVLLKIAVYVLPSRPVFAF